MRLRSWACGLFLAGGVVLQPSPVVSLDPPPVPCHDPERCFSELITALDQLNSGSPQFEKADQIFHQLSTAYSHTEWAARARLRYGYALRSVKPLEAIPLLQHARSDFPILEDYLQFWLFQADVKAELWEAAAKEVRAGIERHSESPVQVEMLYEGGEIFSKDGDCAMARSVLSQALKVGPHHSQAANALFQIGRCARQAGQSEEMIKHFRELWWRFPWTPESVQVEHLLSQASGSAFAPTVGEQFQRGMSFYRRGVWERAVQEFQQVTALAQKTPQYFHAQYQLAMALVRLKKYDQAEQALQVLLDTPSSRQDDAVVWLGRTYLRHNKGEALANLVKTMPVDRLTGDQQSQLSTFYGIWLEDHGRWAEALEAYEKAGQQASTPSRKVQVWWKTGWIQYQRAQYSEAVTLFQKILQETIPPSSSSVPDAAQIWYWLACSEEYLGNLSLARQYFQEIIKAYPMTYYGQLAQTKMGSTGAGLSSPIVLASTDFEEDRLPFLLEHDVHYQRLMALQSVRLSQEALRELDQVYVRHGGDSEMFPQIVQVAEMLGAYDIGIRMAIRHFGSTLRAGQLPPTSPAWSRAFPRGFQHIIQSVVPQHVDPFLVSGVIREESLYKARVVSPAGAIGLMQLMPATAKQVAQELHLSDAKYDAERLYQPEHNIQVGAHYLGKLLQEYQGNIVYAVAAYNAGPRAVQRWIASNGKRPADEFVEGIGYRETREYVKRVVGSYRIYRTLFGQSCPPISLDRFC